MISLHRQHVDIVICVQTSKKTANSPQPTNSPRHFICVWWRVLAFAWWRGGWWRDGLLVATWLVVKLPGGEMTGNPMQGVIT